jgi:hypothetical protein
VAAAPQARHDFGATVLSQRFESGSKLLAEELGLLPRREVAASVEPVVVNEVVCGYRGDPVFVSQSQRDVVEEVVSREVAQRTSLEGLLDQAGLTGPVAVVEHEGDGIDGRVRQPVQRLRTSRHDQHVRHVLRLEAPQLFVRAALLV